MKDAERILATLRIVTLIMLIVGVPLLIHYQRSQHKVSHIESMLYPDPSLLKGDEALNEVREFLKISPRVSGTKNAELAAKYIQSRLLTNGIPAKIDEFTEQTLEEKVTFRNVEAVIKGEGVAPAVVLISHYDTKSGMSDKFKGANDSGSSTGLLIELAKLFIKEPRYPFDLMIVFVDGEECVKQYGPTDGLHGSRHLAEKLSKTTEFSKLTAVIVLDMIGDKNLSVTIPSNCSPRLISILFEAAKELGYRDKFSLLRKAVLDDHSPFIARGVPAIDIIDFEYGENEGDNDYWHTEEDTIDKLSSESLEITGAVLIKMLNILGNKS